MDQRERYFWDLTGYLVVPGVLTAEAIDEANQAIDCIKQWVHTGEDGAGARDSSFFAGHGPPLVSRRQSAQFAQAPLRALPLLASDGEQVQVQ